MAGDVVTLKRQLPCPICGRPAVAEFQPFCSARCADVDLNRWLSGAYVIPAKPETEDEEGSDAPVGGAPDRSGSEDED